MAACPTGHIRDVWYTEGQREGRTTPDRGSRRAARKGSPALHPRTAGVWGSQERINSEEGPFKGETGPKMIGKLLGDK